MYSDSVWQKSQRFGGIVCVIGGIALILLSALLPGSWNTAVMLVIIAVLAIVASGASYKYYSQERQNGL